MVYGFIGCGNMGGAIARALRKNTDRILVTDRSGKAKALARELGVTYADNQTAAETCSAIFLGVKPHMMRDMLLPLQPILARRRPTLITMAAGLTMAQIRSFAGCDLPVIRIMPNTPTAVSRGLIPYCRNDLVDPAFLEQWLADMSACGVLDPLEENLMDAASALSGCGPAYMYLFLEALADGAVACGLPRAKAVTYAAATMAGAAEMVMSTGQHPGALKDAVCSPGGSTIQGVRVLEEHGLRAAAIDCVIAAFEKSKALGK